MIRDGSRPMGKEWTDDDVKAEIAEAVRIVREDKFEAFVRSRTGTQTPQGSGSAPPPKQTPPEPPEPTKVKKGLWWGEALTGDSEDK